MWVGTQALDALAKARRIRLEQLAERRVSQDRAFQAFLESTARKHAEERVTRASGPLIKCPAPGCIVYFYSAVRPHQRQPSTRPEGWWIYDAA